MRNSAVEAMMRIQYPEYSTFEVEFIGCVNSEYEYEVRMYSPYGYKTVSVFVRTIDETR